MTSKKTLLAIPLMAIAVIAIGFGMTSNVFAQPTASTTPAAVDQQDGPNEVQTTDSIANEGPNGNGDDIGANEVPRGNGDGEQPDLAEAGK
jgi:hypothetical protein